MHRISMWSSNNECSTSKTTLSLYTWRIHSANNCSKDYCEKVQWKVALQTIINHKCCKFPTGVLCLILIGFSVFYLLIEWPKSPLNVWISWGTLTCTIWIWFTAHKGMRSPDAMKTAWRILNSIQIHIIVPVAIPLQSPCTRMCKWSFQNLSKNW